MVLRALFAVITAILILSFELTSCVNNESRTEPITITFAFPESPESSSFYALVGGDVASTDRLAVDHLVQRINESNTPPDLLEECSRIGCDRATSI